MFDTINEIIYTVIGASLAIIAVCMAVGGLAVIFAAFGILK